MHFDVACGAMRLIANIGHEGFLDGLGVSRHDFERLVGSDPWLASERNRMTTILHTMINASVDAMGLPRFNLPAEYIAAGISMFVAGVNVMPACIFAPPSRSAEDMGRMAAVDPCTPEQVFALVCQLYSTNGRLNARALFEKKTHLALESVKVSGEKVSK